jgi:heme oxygenase
LLTPQASLEDEVRSPLLSFLLVNPYDNPEPFSMVTPPSTELLGFLQALRPRGLMRSGRLKRDLESLTGLKGTDLDVQLSQYPGENVKAYCEHIRDVVRRKPHTLVAYAWCYYMAVFSGGRWIRAQLVNAGGDFWSNEASDSRTDEKGVVVPLEEQGLALWNFEGDSDGEDIKAEFKRRLLDAEVLFADDERLDIIEEAKQIFNFSAKVVEELDGKLGTDMELLDRLQLLEKKRALEKRATDEEVTLKESQVPFTWLRRPEVTGAVVALGCLAYVALLKLDVGLGW